MVDFPSYLQREITFVTSCLLSDTPCPFQIGATLKRRNMLLSVDPCSQGRQKGFDRVGSLTSLYVLLKVVKGSEYISLLCYV